MFHRHHEADVSAVAPSRVTTVRLLENDDELQVAVERARAFEDRGQRRVVNYDRYLREGHDELANVLHIDSARSAELLAELGSVEAPAP
jgi:hypothetical protein